MKTLFNRWSKMDSSQVLATETNANENTSLFSQAQKSFMALNPKMKGLLIGVTTLVMILLLVIIALSVNHESNTVTDLKASTDTSTKAILGELDDVNSQLRKAASHSGVPANVKSMLNIIAANITDIKSSVNQLAKASDVQKVSSQVASMQNDMDSQMEDLKQTVANGEGNKHYLDPKVLPFHVISIDVISQQPFVSVDYAHHVTPLAVGDAVAGWQIVSADYDSAQAVFKNDKDKYVKVSLQGE